MQQPLLALDLGGKRIGVAVNPTGSVVLELPTILRPHGEDIVPRILALIEEYGVRSVVIGVQRASNNELSNLAEHLMAALPIPVYPLDETLTTKEAERQLQDEGGGDSDARAARLILEQALERLRSAS